jgi:hypothetical protein
MSSSLIGVGIDHLRSHFSSCNVIARCNHFNAALRNTCCTTCRIPNLVLIKCECNVLDHQHWQSLIKREYLKQQKGGLKIGRI